MKRSLGSAGATPPLKRAPFTQIADPTLDDSFDDLIQDLEWSPMKPSVSKSPWAALGSIDLRLTSQSSEEGGLLLQCTEVKTGTARSVLLLGSWADSRLRPGDALRLLGPTSTDHDGRLTLSDREPGFLLTQPDTLVPCTSVTSGVYCRRKAVLNERLRGLDGGNKWMLVGTLVHAVFQDALALIHEELPNLVALRKRLIELLGEEKMILSILKYKLDLGDLIKEIEPYLVEVKRWLSEYVGRESSKRKELRLTNSTSTRIESIRDIEESIWDPRWGIRGKIDVSLVTRSEKGARTVVPLELKTGRSRNGADHQAQVALYNLMLSSVSDESGEEGLLLYLQDGSAFPVKVGHGPLKSIIQLRNSLASHLSSVTGGAGDVWSLPDPLDDPRACGSCALRLPCAAWQRSFETLSLQASHTHTKLVPETLAHLEESHLQYFAKWMRWLCLEWAEDLKRSPAQSRIWSQESLDKENKHDTHNRWTIAKVKNTKSSAIVTFSQTISGGQIPVSEGDMVVVSDETDGHFGVFLSPVVNVNDDGVAIRLDRAPRSGIMTHQFRLHRYSSAASHTLHLNNIVRLMGDEPIAKRLRSLIIDRAEPEFIEALPRGILKQIRPFISGLNPGQLRAIVRTLMAKDFVLIQGLPGSGKTTTICNLIRVLVSLGSRVLLSAYTHSAVDNCLLKLKDTESADWLSSVVRVGASSQIHPEIRGLSLSSRLEASGSEGGLGLLSSLASSARVVASTCLETWKGESFVGAAGPFDVVVVDEASLCLASAALGPLLRLKERGKCVLVGDPAQLSPLVLCEKAGLEGMSQSLMSSLGAPNGKSLVCLTQQFRMNKLELCRLSSSLFYNGELVCGSEEVAARTMRPLKTSPTDRIQKLLASTSLSDSILILDTSGAGPDFESRRQGSGLSNAGEARVAAAAVAFLLCGGVRAEDVGVASFYRDQVKCLAALLEGQVGVEVRTVDQYQGREKDVLLLSAAWNPPSEKDKPESMSRLIAEESRLNVALSRARKKLIFIGSWERLVSAHLSIQRLGQLLSPHHIHKLELTP